MDIWHVQLFFFFFSDDFTLSPPLVTLSRRRYAGFLLNKEMVTLYNRIRDVEYGHAEWVLYKY